MAAKRDDPATRSERLSELIEEFRTRVENAVDRSAAVVDQAKRTATASKIIVQRAKRFRKPRVDH